MKSMTGFGAGRARVDTPLGQGIVSVEIKTVNQRFFDARIVLPKEYAPFEAECRKIVEKIVARGRTEVNVGRTLTRRAVPRIEIDLELARAHVNAWRRVQKTLHLPGEVDLGVLRGVPELFRSGEAVARADAELPSLRRALKAALRQLERARVREGKHLERDMRARIRRLERIVARMKPQADQALRAVRSRIEDRMRELLAENVDEARVVQEAAFQAERGVVTEEIVRLGSHLSGLRDLFRAPGPVGKQSDFLLQEIQREVNTIASKSNDLGLTRLAVDAKAEIEKLREQVQNVE